MKKLALASLLLLAGIAATGCSDNAKTIVVGATPSPHAQILNNDLIKNYISSKGYTLTIKEYQDYKTPNRALNDGTIDANYFQHIPYLNEEIETHGYEISAVAKIHYEPLNLYGQDTSIKDFSNKTISIIDDVSNVERALKLLVANGIISTYSVENFDAAHPVYTSEIGAKIECIEAGLLHLKVEQGDYAVIPGNYALTAWGAETAIRYRVLGEDEAVAGEKANIIATRTADIRSEKTNILCEALAQEGVAALFESLYGPTVVYSYSDIRA